MNIYRDAAALVGHTPLVGLANYGKSEHLAARLVGKLECMNPAGSVKDRVALAMILDAERRGFLKPGAVIVEPTSGNTGIGLASMAAARGCRVILTMPESMSVERRNLLKAYGAELILTEAAKGMNGAVEKAKEIAAVTPNSFLPGQFENPANPAVHYTTTGPEVWKDTDGKVDILVAGVGTGGTLSGAGRYLKEQNPMVQVAAVEPAASPLLTGGSPAGHPLQGIGANFIPENLDRKIYDEVIDVEAADAFAAVKAIARTEGLLIGISGGAAVAAATKLAKRAGNEDKMIVVILPDNGERYLSVINAV